MGHGVILVYDVTDATSFANCRNWIQEISRYAGPDVEIMLVGNKCDMTNKRKVAYSTAHDYADGLDIPFYEASAKNSSNVEGAIVSMTQSIHKKRAPSHTVGSRMPL